MDVKGYLSQVRQADRRIDALLERRRRYRELAERRGGRVEALEGLERDIDARIDAYAGLVREIEGVIDRVEEAPCREVLRYRYLNGWSWQVISDRTHYSKDWLWRLHARGLEEIGKREAMN